MKTMVNIKTDMSLKREAQRVAAELGLSLSTLISHFLKELVAERTITFTDHPMPNARTSKILKGLLADARAGKNLAGPFDTAEGMIKSLRS